MKANTQSRPIDRRAFLRAGARWLTLGIAAAGAARLAREGRIGPAAGCGGDGVCSQCTEVDICGHPRALSRRRAIERGRAIV